MLAFALLVLSSAMTVSAQEPTPTPTSAPGAVTPTPAQAPPAAAFGTLRDDPAVAVEFGTAVQSMPANKGQWLRFDYDTAGNQFPRPVVTVRLLNGVTNGLGFEIWSQERFAEGNWWEISPVGRGTQEVLPNCTANPERTDNPSLNVGDDGKCKTNDLTWTGGFGAPGTYYVRLVNPTNNSAVPQMIIGGPGLTQCLGVDFNQPAPQGQVASQNEAFIRVQCRDAGAGQIISQAQGG
jgi:hypothetical protein